MMVMIAGLRRARIETAYASMIFPFVVGNIIITSLVFGRRMHGWPVRPAGRLISSRTPSSNRSGLESDPQASS